MIERKREVKLRGIDRSQQFMEITDFNTMIAADHPARAIWAFIESLDLSDFYERINSKAGEVGSPSYDPKMKIALWIYAYSQGISSAREVEQLCKEDRSWKWLCANNPINHHTLSDFRIGYKEELDKLFTNSLGIMSSEGLISLERITQDGTKIRASAGIDTFKKGDKLKKHLELAKKQVELLSDAESEPSTKRKQKAQERAAKEKNERLEQAIREYNQLNSKREGKEKRVSTTDPECRIMKQSNGGYNPSYNVQIAVDALNKIIIGKQGTSNSEDSNEFVPMQESIKKDLGRYPDQIIVDGGYTTYPNIMMNAKQGIDLIGGCRGDNKISDRRYEKRNISKEFQSKAFRYDKNLDEMICPEGKRLETYSKEELPGRTNFQYRAKEQDCAICSSKSMCCPKSKGKGRRVTRKELDKKVLAFQEKMETEEAKLIYKKRGENAEFVNAWIKDKIKLRQFRLRNLSKINIEVTLATLAYNIMRWFRLRWIPALG